MWGKMEFLEMPVECHSVESGPCQGRHKRKIPMYKSATIVLRNIWLAMAAGCLPVAGMADGLLWYPYASGLGADGYDVVSYFVAGKPQKGTKKFSLEHRGAKWHFSSADNLEQFKANPDQYLPQYGGHCAYAMGKDYQAFGDPQVWAVHEGRLFFNYNHPVQQVWEVERGELIPAADENWSRLIAPPIPASN